MRRRIVVSSCHSIIFLAIISTQRMSPRASSTQVPATRGLNSRSAAGPAYSGTAAGATAAARRERRERRPPSSSSRAARARHALLVHFVPRDVRLDREGILDRDALLRLDQRVLRAARDEHGECDGDDKTHGGAPTP